MRFFRSLADDIRELVCLFRQWRGRGPIAPQQDETLHWLQEQQRMSTKRRDFLETVVLNRENRR